MSDQHAEQFHGMPLGPSIAELEGRQELFSIDDILGEEYVLVYHSDDRMVCYAKVRHQDSLGTREHQAMLDEMHASGLSRHQLGLSYASSRVVLDYLIRSEDRTTGSTVIPEWLGNLYHIYKVEPGEIEAAKVKLGLSETDDAIKAMLLPHQIRESDLLAKLNAGTITTDELRELSVLIHIPTPIS